MRAAPAALARHRANVGGGARRMLALVVALGLLGMLALAALVSLGPRPSGERPASPRPLHSVAVTPIVAEDASLDGLAAALRSDVARRLATAMPHLRVVEDPAAGNAARFRLEGELADGPEGVAVTWRLVDLRAGRTVGTARSIVALANFGGAAALVEPDARRLVARALLEAAAKD